MFGPLLVLAAIATAATDPVSRYRPRWSTPPTRIGSGHFPDAPILGNGDLGVSVGANLTAGSIELHLGLNQLWGIGHYERQAGNPFQGGESGRQDARVWVGVVPASCPIPPSLLAADGHH